MKVAFVAPDDWYIHNFKMPVINKIRDKNHETVVITEPGDRVEKIKSRGHKWKKWDIEHHSTNPIKEAITLVNLLKIYKKEEPDIVHHYTAKGIIYGTISAKACGVSKVINAVTGGVSALGNVISENGKVYEVFRWILEKVFRAVLRNTEVIFQNPDDMRSFIGSGTVESRRAHLVKGSGANLEKFQGSDEVDDDRMTVILAGRLLWNKGVGEFVEAARLVRRRKEHVDFVLVGEAGSSNPKSVSTDQIRRWEQEGLIEWWGFCEDMPSVFKEAHIVCSPTYYSEGVPKVLIEAAASERPIVTTDMPGCREIVQDGENGILVPPKDPGALAEAILTLVDNKSMRRRMGRRGREIVKEEFSVTRVVEQTMDIYNEMSNGKI